MLTKEPDCVIVKRIIDEALCKKQELNQDPCISTTYVVEMIKNRFHPTHIFNKIANYHDDRHDGVSSDGILNMDRGAKKLYRNCVDYLQSYFVINDNKIRSREAFSEKYECDGREKTLREWAQETGINHKTLVSRVVKRGWNIERALTEPVAQRHKPQKQKQKVEEQKSSSDLIEFNGKIQTISEWSEEVGIALNTLLWRLQRWPVKESLTLPVGNKNPLLPFVSNEWQKLDLVKENFCRSTDRETLRLIGEGRHNTEVRYAKKKQQKQKKQKTTDQLIVKGGNILFSRNLKRLVDHKLVEIHGNQVRNIS